MSYRRTWLLVDVMNRCWDSAADRHGGRRIERAAARA
jgi:molybdenum-dependent DNA-binding transcriptional regulator ModE